MENSTEIQNSKSTNWVWTDVGISDLAAFFLKAIIALIPVSIIVAGAVFLLGALVKSIDH